MVSAIRTAITDSVSNAQQASDLLNAIFVVVLQALASPSIPANGRYIGQEIQNAIKHADLSVTQPVQVWSHPVLACMLYDNNIASNRLLLSVQDCHRLDTCVWP